MYKFFTKTDGLQIAIDMAMVMMVEDMDDCRILITPYFEVEVIETFDQIFDISGFKINLN